MEIAECPLLAQSGHRLVHCTCPLLTQSGHSACASGGLLPVAVRSALSLFAARQDDVKDRSVRRARRRPHASAVGFDDRAANGQSYAHAIGLRRKLRVEDKLHVARIDSRSGIFHCYPYSSRITKARFDHQQPFTVRDRAHRLERVCYQVQEDLLQLGPIRDHLRKVAEAVQFEPRLDISGYHREEN